MNESNSYDRNLLDSRQLRAFLMLASKGNFTLAAKELNLTQSAVSHAVKALEEDVGCRLLDRMGKKVLLTQAGEQFHSRAEKIFEEMSAARADLDILNQWGQGRLRIGAGEMACQHILPSVLREFQRKFPECRLNIDVGDTTELVNSLNENEIDIAMTLEPVNEPSFEFRSLFTDELAFLVDPKHPWASMGRVLRANIPRQKYLFYFRNSRTFELIEDYFRAENVEIKSVVEIGSMSAIKELVKLGLGITILAPWIAQAELAKKTLVALPAGRRKLKRKWGLLFLKGRAVGWAEETFARLCESGTTQFAARNGLRSHV
ncbi:MAG: LysR family transcriptional regulator [Verrucomicrobiota bacterium]|nr:LysR family transcriptional regulator [Verrucomicrobiota bacterium]